MEEANTLDASASAETSSQGGDSSVQSQATTGTPTEEFSAGWNYEDEAQPEPTAEAEDADLQGMMNDPGLDQTKAPGLVEAIKRERADNKQHRAEIGQLRQELET